MADFCPHCLSQNIVKDGKRTKGRNKGMQLWKCKNKEENCEKKFIEATSRSQAFREEMYSYFPLLGNKSARTNNNPKERPLITIAGIARRMGRQSLRSNENKRVVSRSTVYRYLKDWEAEGRPYYKCSYKINNRDEMYNINERFSIDVYKAYVKYGNVKRPNRINLDKSGTFDND